DAGLPAILRLDRLPLRIPHPPFGTDYREAPGHGVVARTHDRRLVLWTDTSTGPIEVADHTPPGALRDFRLIAGVVHLVTVGSRGTAPSWLRLDLEGGVAETVELPSIGRPPSGCVVFGDAGECVGLLSGRSLHVASIDDPTRFLGGTELPSRARPAGGRLFA